MKTLTFFLFSLLLGSGLVPMPLGAAPRHPQKPLLWKIEGKGLEKPSYLFGTIHLGDKAITTLHPAARKAFDAASSLHTEVAMDPASQLAMAGLFARKDGKTLSQSLGKDLTARLNKQLSAINPALNASTFNGMRTWFPAITLYSLEDQMKGRQPLDLVLWNRATAADKATRALETAEGQIGKLNQLTDKEQVMLVRATVEELEKTQKEGDDPMERLKQAYLRGDAAAIEKTIHDSMVPDDNFPQAFIDKFNRLLFTERNATMAASIRKQLEQSPDESHFFAAGAGHFLGKSSVNALLEKAGYQVTRVTE